MKRILVSGAGGAPATNFVRSLRLMKEPVYLVGTDCNVYTLQRAETDVKLLVPRVGEADYLEIINGIITEYGVEFLHVQNDRELEFISENRDKLKAKVFLPALTTMRLCFDKYASYQAWREAGIKVPETTLLKTVGDLRVAMDKLGPKIWLRDIKGAAGNGSYPTSDFEEALSWINFKKGWGHFTAAECLTEQSVTWMSIWNHGELIVAQGRKRVYWELSDRAPSGVTGVTGTGVTYADSNLDELAIRTILAVDKKPHGIFSVDMTYDTKGTPNPTEINVGRFFTTHLFFSQAGLNMPEIVVKLAYGEDFPKPERVLNPLLNGLVWVRGVDFCPVLTTTENVLTSEKALQIRRQD